MRLSLAVVLAAIPCGSAALPPRRTAKHPWDATPTTADAVRSLRHSTSMRMLAHHNDEEPMSEAELAASFEAFLEARGSRMVPMWENHTHAERTANLQLHHANRRRQRRRAQAMLGTNLFSGSTEQEKDDSLALYVDPISSTCDDPLATNTDQPQPCTYDCNDLINEYFPQPQSQTTRCFLFDPTSNTWPEVGGEGAELLSMREQRLETHTYVSREDGTNPPPAGISFSIGAGRVCRNVTIQSTMMGTGETHIEEVCLVDGEHEYNHTINEAHTVEVVGYAESDVHEEAGGTTAFVVGECVDVLIRVTTTSAGGESVSWSLDDGGHNGPWLFDSV
eukprot:COSAG04_NODE_2086_length_4830_cov_2.263581_4_plen_334_part_01